MLSLSNVAKGNLYYYGTYDTRFYRYYYNYETHVVTRFPLSWLSTTAFLDSDNFIFVDRVDLEPYLSFRK